MYVKKEEEEERLVLNCWSSLKKPIYCRLLGSCSNFNLQTGFLNEFPKEHQEEEEEAEAEPSEFKFSTFVLL